MHHGALVLVWLNVLCACGETAVVDAPRDGADAAADQTAEPAGSDRCDTFGATGVAPRCKIFAFCATGEYAIDCTAGGDLCRCITVTGKGRRDVAYDPAFCALPDGGDPLDTAEALDGLFAAAVRACEWSP